MLKCARILFFRIERKRWEVVIVRRVKDTVKRKVKGGETMAFGQNMTVEKALAASLEASIAERKAKICDT